MTITLVRADATSDEMFEAAVAMEHEAETLAGVGLNKRAGVLNMRAQELRKASAAQAVKEGSAKGRQGE
jgi:hypothetical protein